MRLTRRRILTVLAALPAGSLPAFAVLPQPIRGQAMGAQVTLHLDHPEAARLGGIALAEIRRLEGIFSLYLADSALVRLNREGRLDRPPPELLECLTLCAAVHRASAGLFDPTVQPLWATLAQAHATGRAPDPARMAAARRRIGWDRVRFGPDRVMLDRGQALTLNGIAQGVVADRIAALLRQEGLEVGLIDAGEIVAVGSDWPVRVAGGPRLRLTDRSLATSGPFGTVLDLDGRQGHILSPFEGAAAPRWRSVSVSAPRAALADALSTAVCLMPDEAAIAAMVGPFAGARVEDLAPVA
ncbi:MAG: FAD:protein FMN transferase [Gemmobacter sp.]